MTISRILAEFVYETGYDDLPKWVDKRTRMYILDELGVQLLGSTSKPARILADLAFEVGGREECVMIGHYPKTSCLNSAMVNGTSNGANDWMCDHTTANCHIGAVVVPAAVAAAEREGVDDKLLVLAAALGYEVTARIGEAFLGRLYAQGLHPSTVCGVFGAAVAAGKIFELDKEGLMNALGIAGTQAFGCGFGEGWNKRMHYGMAARIGVTAALMAERKYHASTPGRIVERALKACAYQGEYDVKQIVGGNGRGRFGEEWRGMLMSYKPYPCCKFLHHYISLTLKMVKEHDLRPEDVDSITTSQCREFYNTLFSGQTYSTPERVYSPIDPIDAQFSAPWTIATVIVKRNIGLYDYFTVEGLRDSNVLNLAKRISGIVDPEYERLYPKEWPIRINVRLKDGREIVETTKEVPGDPQSVPEYGEKPGLFEKEIEEKFKSLLSELPPYPNRINNILEAMKHAKKVTELTELFRARPKLKVPLLYHVDI
ncbi:MAG: MmgE/PrpD family protein [Candidatus Bathyarchaeia archaeon]